MPADECPSESVLSAFHDGDLRPAEIDRVAAHLESCPACEARLDRLDDSATVAAAFRQRPGTNGPGDNLALRQAIAEGVVVGGRFTLVERIGEGGMGSVWLARQSEPVRRKVALKFVKLGMDSRQVLARFEAERQALALMDHPNIAKVLDAGATAEGCPFFVMELVKGVPITQFCDERQLTLRERLGLFVPVCHAIQHAHMKGVIHRDIKPTNVLVGLYDDTPIPKVIDFGVAKATGGRLSEATIDTVSGGVVGTPAYMSPEQTALNNPDIDTRSDVYSLGVLLYELLTGTPPLSEKELGTKGLDEILRVVREEEAPRPSTRVSTADTLASLSARRGSAPRELTALLRGELDWIVLKAIEKDRGRRYETASQFAADIGRYLAGEEVLAHPPTAAYRLRKFLRRNRRAVLTASLVAGVLVAGIVGTTLGLLAANKARNELANKAEDERRAKEQAEKEADAARRAKARAERARDRTADVLDAMTSTVTGDSLATQFALSPDQKRFLNNVLVYYREFVGEVADDEPSRARVAMATYRVGLIESRLGRDGESSAAFRIAADAFAGLAADFPASQLYRKLQVDCRVNLALGSDRAGRGAEAEGSIREALRHAEKFATDFPTAAAGRTAVARCRNVLGTMLAVTGKSHEAEKEFRAALALLTKLVEEFPADGDVREVQVHVHITFAPLLQDLGKFAEAEEQLRRARVLAEQLATERPGVADFRMALHRSHTNLGVLLRRVGRMDEAGECYRLAVTEAEKLVAAFPNVPAYRMDQAGSSCNFGQFLLTRGRPTDALPWLDRAIVILDPMYAAGSRDPQVREFLRNSHWGRATAYGELKRGTEAVKDWERVVALSAPDDRTPEERATVVSARTRLGGAYCNLGLDERDAGRRAESVKWFDQAVATLAPLHAADPRSSMVALFLRNSHAARAETLDLLGRPADSVKDWEQVVRLSADPALTPRRGDRAWALLRTGRVADAVNEVTVMAKLSGWNAQTWHQFARVCALAAAKDANRRAEYADLAVGYLRRAVETGWKGATPLRETPEFEVLRDRDDFRKLLAEVEKTGPRGPKK